MADLSSVEQALVSAITQIIYPGGTANPSIAGVDVSIYRGWPQPGDLDNDLATGVINVTVFAQDNERNVTRFPREWQLLNPPVVDLTLTPSDTAITVGGTASSPINAAATVNGRPYVYPVQPGDTLTTIATALAQLINADTPATSSGPVVTIPGAYRIASRVGGFGDTIREIRRQKRGFIISFWCPDPESRDAIVAPVDAALAEIDYLSLPDGTAARLVYEKSVAIDRDQNAGSYRRDLYYSAEYATTQTQSAAQIVHAVLKLADFAGDSLPPPEPDLYALLLEDGSYMLMEDGSRLLLNDSPTPPHLAGLLLESGGSLLREDGGGLALDFGPPRPATFGLRLESGGSLLTEDGGRLLLNHGTPGLGLLLESGRAMLAEGGGSLLLDDGLTPTAFALEDGTIMTTQDGTILIL